MTTSVASGIVLTEEQDAALHSILAFLVDPSETVIVLSGYAGCGKSTLVHTLINQLPDYMEMMKLVMPDLEERDVVLTATTNKAAEALEALVHAPVKTIHSALGLRVSTDYKTQKTSLTAAKPPVGNLILFIDEASYIDYPLLKLIFQQAYDTKFVFIGDPAQLTAVGTSASIVFQRGFKEVRLTEIVRQAKGNPIIELATNFRETVETGNFFNFVPDGVAVQRLSREDFDAELLTEFTRADWRYSDSKVLAWTNARVIAYNHCIRSHVKGDPQLQVGDYAICNSFVSDKGISFKTDQTVLITGIKEKQTHYEVEGKVYELNGNANFFMPNSLADKNTRLKKAQNNGEYGPAAHINNTWIDLRAAYSCTVNKAQGSTYDKVFIDLSDISRCNSGNQIARMLYVAVSRARHTVYLTGDLVK